MKILHLTDLHLTEPGATLENLWAGVSPLVPDSVDFVVISGDLTQRAQKGEYEKLKKFLDTQIIRRVRSKDPARIVMVPGNHDVDWSREILKHGDVDSGTARRYLRDADAHVRSRVSPQMRAIVDLPRLSIREIDHGKYHARFEPVQSFLDGFYTGIGAPHRKFNLTSIDDSEHWSAHVFPQHGVAFAGLSSCTWNDEYWRAGAISDAATRAAGEYLAGVAPGCLHIAVWHHGLVSARGQPDHMTLVELGRIINQGFQLGLHGHTHQDEVETLHHWLKGRAIPIVATGSFAAKASERPGGVRNQVSLLEVSSAVIRWTIFARRENSEQWEAEPSRFLPMAGLSERMIELVGESLVDRHERFAFVDEQGIVTIRVVLYDVDLEGELVLASGVRAPGTVLYDKQAVAQRVDGGKVTLDVAAEEGADALVRSERRQHFAKIEWSYVLSNVLALHPDEVGFISPDRKEIKLAPSEHDIWMHHLRFCCNKLKLRLELPAQRLKRVGTPQAQYQEANGKWHHDAQASAVARRSNTNAVVLSVSRPRPGHRYGVSYSLSGGREKVQVDTWDLIGTVVERCRNEELRPASLASQLTAHTEAGLARLLAPTSARPPPTRWVVHHWNLRRLSLQSAYGRFPARTWGSSFGYGQGIAGHAFKVRGPAVYHRDGSSNASRAIYSRFGERTEHNWIVSLPLVRAPGQPPVGVIGFADYEGGGSAWLEQCAKELASHQDVTRAARFEEIDETFSKIGETMSLAFWMWLADCAKHDDSLAIAQAVFDDWKPYL